MLSINSVSDCLYTSLKILTDYKQAVRGGGGMGGFWSGFIIDKQSS